MPTYTRYTVDREIFEKSETRLILMDPKDIRKRLEEREKSNAYLTPILRPVQSHWKTLAIDMTSFSSDDSTCAPTVIPSPNEFSRLSLDPHASRLIATTFNSRPDLTSTELRYYQFISQSIKELEKELSRQKDERQILYDQLFERRKFRHRIRPIVMEYRHRLAMKRRGYYPYGR